MRTYSNGTNGKKASKSFFKKNVYAISLGIALILVALTVTLVMTLGRKPADPPIVDTATPPAASKVVFTMPLKECIVRKDASLEELVWNSTLQQWRTHNGIDFAAEKGESVFSVLDGTVSKVEDSMLEGLVVTVAHTNGFVSIYKGLEGVTVKADDVVKAGDTLGKVSDMLYEQDTYTHLHLELLKDGEYVNPADYLLEGDEK